MMFDQKRILSLPAPDSSAGSESLVERAVIYQAQPEATDTESTARPLSHYLWLLNRDKWKLLAFVSLVVLCTVILSSRMTKYYQSTATVDVDRMAPTEVIGQQSNARAINDAEQFLSTQVKLIQSDSVLRPVVQQYGRAIAAATGTTLGSSRAQAAPVSLNKLAITRPLKTYLIQISYRSPRSCAGRGCRQRCRAKLSGSHVLDPLSGVSGPGGFRHKAA